MSNVSVLFNVLALILFAIVVALLWPEKRALGRITAAGLLFVFCALLGNPDRFDTVNFSFNGIQTKAKEVIKQAQVTIEQLQKLSTALADASLN